MHDLFRFLVLRTPGPAGEVVELDVDSRLHGQLRAARQGDRPREAVREAAAVYAGSADAVTATGELQLAPRLLAFVDLVAAEDGDGLDRVAGLVERVFDRPAASVVDSPEYAVDRQRALDTLVAAKLAPGGRPLPVGLVDVARALDLLRRTAAGDSGLDRPGALAAARTALLVLPADVVPLAPEPLETPPTEPPGEPDQQGLADQVRDLQSAVQTLRGLDQPPTTGEPPTGPRHGRDTLESRFATFVRNDLNAPRPAELLESTGATVLSGRVLEQLPAVARELLDRTRPATPTRALDLVHGAYLEAVGRLDRRAIGRLLPDLHLDPVTEPGPHDEAADPSPAPMAALPATHGSITPAGIADLLVTRHHTLRYEPGDVAHVENVATGEALTRETRRLDTSETTTVQVSEVVSEDERDQQTTGRFDLAQEADSVVKDDQARVPGQPSSESYGSLVETGRSQSASRKEAETYGRDVTSRATTRITSRASTSVTTRVLRELEEKATHAFASGAGPASVVYQWLDRVVQAQVFSYGKRLVYDLVVPEPAAFLAGALAEHPLDTPLPPRPAPFTLEPSLLSEWNWSWYVAGYGATGVTPPPPPTVTVARTFAGLAQNVFSDSAELRSTLTAQGTTVEVPDGYQAHSAVVKLSWGGWDGANQDLDLVVGTRRLSFSWDTARTLPTPLDGETGQLALTARTDGGIYSYTIAIEITCTLTEERLARWQVATHAAVLGAARERQADYEQRLAQVRAGLRLLSAGQPAARKREMERSELRKACLAVITNQQFDGLSAVEHSPQGYPQPYLPNVELYGRYLRFLENAFEWEQMTWRYAPYFWGRKPYWVQAVLREDPDPVFADFLRAGAARVLVPVRPGYETAVTDFMQTGAVPTGADLGDVTSPLYVPLLQELREPDTALDSGTPYSQPWEVRLPTTLLAMRSDATLPRWEQVAGTPGWVVVAGDPLP